MSALRGRSFGIGKVSLPARTTWWGHLLWVLGAAVLSTAVAAIFAGVLQLPRNLYLLFYFASIGALLYGYVRWSGVESWKGIREHWVWGLVVGAVFGFFTVQTVLIQPSSPTPQGAELAFDLVWLGLIYGAASQVIFAPMATAVPLFTYSLVFGAVVWVVVAVVALAQGGHLSRQPLRRRVA